MPSQFDIQVTKDTIILKQQFAIGEVFSEFEGIPIDKKFELPLLKVETTLKVRYNKIQDKTTTDINTDDMLTGDNATLKGLEVSTSVRSAEDKNNRADVIDSSMNNT